MGGAHNEVALLGARHTQERRAVAPVRPKAVRSVRSQIGLIGRTEIERPDGGRRALGDWLVAEITTDVIEQFQRRRAAAGHVAANRDLGVLRACFNWACSKKRKLAAENPFRDGERAAITFAEEHARTRRLQEGEGEQLLAACSPHLRSIVECALETGMRRGEILSLQWRQVEGMQVDEAQVVTWAPKATLFLPHQKTKTNRDRRVPISTRLKAILEMRRFDPAGHPHALDKFVFGTEIGGQIQNIGRAWHRAILRAYGHQPAYTAGANLSPASRQVLREIGLHFHDLRRECGSRWMDAGVPIATIQRWLGHSNVSQTSTYLAGTATSEHEAMRKFEEHQAALQRLATAAGTGGQTGAQTAASGDERPSENAVGSGPAIM